MAVVCKTPGAVYISDFKVNQVGGYVEERVTLPDGIHIPEEDLDKLENEIHDALEGILAKYFKEA